MKAYDSDLPDSSVSSDGPTNRAAYKKPILASLYQNAGRVGVALLIVLGVVLLFMVGAGDSKALLSLTILFVTLLLSTLINFGLAEIIETVAKIEYHASGEKNAEMLKTLVEIRELLAKSEATTPVDEGKRT